MSGRAWGPGSRPRVRSEIQATDVEGELVLWDPVLAVVHRLDRVASLLWPFFDGSASLEELADDVHDVWGTSRAEALSSLTELVEQMERSRLLADAEVDGDPDPPPRQIADPTRCGVDLERWAWAPTIVVDVAGRLIALRTRGAAAPELLRAALEAHVVDEEAPANLSLVIADRPGDLHLLYWGKCLVARTRTVAELLRILEANLRAHGPVPEGAVRLDAVAIRAGDRAVGVSTAGRRLAWQTAARLGHHGAELLPNPHLDIDAGSLAVLPPRSPLVVDRAAAERLLALHGEQAPRPPAEPPSPTITGLAVSPHVAVDSTPAALATGLVEDRTLAQPGVGLPLLTSLLPRLGVCSLGGASVAGLVAFAAERLGLPKT